MRPCLAVHEDGQPRTSADVRDRIAELMQVTAEDRAILLPSGSQPLFTNRVAWAVTHLAQVGLLDRPSRVSRRSPPGAKRSCGSARTGST
jgi:restriction system protein